MPDSMRPAMAAAPHLPLADAAAAHDADRRLAQRWASAAMFQYFKAIFRSDRCACARWGRFLHHKEAPLDRSRNISPAFSHISLDHHLAAGPVSKPASRFSRVARTEQPTPTHTCWVYCPEPAFSLPRRTSPLDHSFVKSCTDLILAGGGVPAEVLCGGDARDVATTSTP
jgi:hypothetical protein